MTRAPATHLIRHQSPLTMLAGVEIPVRAVLVVWAGLFLLQHQWDASAIYQHGGEAALLDTVVNATADGSVIRRAVTITLGLVGAVWMVWKKHVGKSSPFNWIAFLLCGYLGWATISVLWAVEPGLTVRRLVSSALLLLFAVACARRLTLKQLSGLAIGCATLNIVVGVISEIAHASFQTSWADYRFSGTLHPNVQAATLSVAAIISVWLTRGTRGVPRLVAYARTSVFLGFLWLTGSRTSGLAVIVALGVLGVLAALRQRRRAQEWAAMAVTAMLVIGIAGLASQVIDPNRFIQASRDERAPTELNGRAELWDAAVRLGTSRPLTGFGYEGFWSPPRILALSEEFHWPINHAHSLYIDQWLMLGLVGVLAYTAMLLGVFARCVRRFIDGQDSYGAWIAVLSFVLITGITESIFIQPTFPAFLLNVLVLAIAVDAPARGWRLSTRVQSSAAGAAQSVAAGFSDQRTLTEGAR